MIKNTNTTKILATSILFIIILIIVRGTVVANNERNKTYVLYKIGDNSITKEVSGDEIEDYVNDSYEWSVEPTVLMYTEDGRQSWIWESEVSQYKEAGWSMTPPVVIFGANGTTRTVLLERKHDYLNTGVWFETYEEANPPIFTYNVFQRSNLTVDQLNRILSGTGLSGYGQSFYTMEQTYSVNALFCIAVGAHESANFYKTANRNNYFGFRGNRGWMNFSSPDACIMYFGQLMNNKLYYGKTIEQIAVIYCDANWTKHVKAHMNEKWAKIN